MSNDSSKKTVLACVIGVLFIIGMIGSKTPEKCKTDGCSRTTVENSRYCSIHDPFYEGARLYERNHSGSSYSSSASKTNSSSSSSSSSSYKSSSSSSSSSGYKSSSSSKSSYNSKTSMPDCDDYEDYDDFMDDWDGCMPDGSDAEDYWEDW